MVAVATKPRYSYTDEGGAHLHALDGRPLHGTSTVVKEVIKPPLTWWAAGMSLEPLGWLNVKKSTAEERHEAANAALFRLAHLSIETYADFLQKCYRAHADYSNKAADDGTNMHYVLEKYVKACIESGGSPAPIEKFDPLLCYEQWEHGGALRKFSEWSCANVKRFLWSEAHCYSERLWVGGISDCGALLHDGDLAVIDFKSSKEAYFSQFVQCGGYATQITENGLFTSDGEQTATHFQHSSGCGIYNTTEGGGIVLVVFPFRGDGPRIEDAAPFVEDFENIVGIYKHMQAYDN